MAQIQLLETILYDPKEGLFLLDYHFDRMLSSAQDLCPFFANNPERFLQTQIPTRSELSSKIQQAIAQSGTQNRQRLRLLLDFEGSVMIQSSQLPSETGNTSSTSSSTTVDATPSISVVLDTAPTPSDTALLHHKTTQRQAYDDARSRAGLGPLGGALKPGQPFDVILYNERQEIMETSITNIAIQMEQVDGSLEWITPPVRSGLLPGVMRRKLLEDCEIKEGIVTVKDLKLAVEQGRGVKCFNSVRKEFLVQVV